MAWQPVLGLCEGPTTAVHIPGSVRAPRLPIGVHHISLLAPRAAPSVRSGSLETQVLALFSRKVLRIDQPPRKTLPRATELVRTRSRGASLRFLCLRAVSRASSVTLADATTGILRPDDVLQTPRRRFGLRPEASYDALRRAAPRQSARISRRANFRAAEKFEKNPIGLPRRRLTTLFATI